MSAWVYQSPEETGTGYYEGKVRKWKVKYYIVVFYPNIGKKNLFVVDIINHR